MTDYEAGLGPEFATDDELAGLYQATLAQLLENGEYWFEPHYPPSGVAEDGLPIADAPPVWRFQIDGAVLRRLLPEQANVLDVGDRLLILHTIAHWELSSESPEGRIYLEPDCQFDIDRPQKSDSDVDSETIFVTPREGRTDQVGAEGGWRVDRLLIRADTGPDFSDFTPDTGMTREEYDAVNEIVNNLRRIKEAQNRTDE